MNREIKFRVWVDNKMITPDEDCDLFFLLHNSQYFELQDHNNCIDGKPNELYNNAEDADFILMQFTGLKDKNNNEIFECSICDFPYIENGFERSKCGEIMKKYAITSLRISFNQSEYLSLDYDIFFIKNNKIITCKEWYELCDDDYSDTSETQLIELNKPYSQSDSDLHFMRYLTSRGNLEIIGNIYQNPELLK
ncbi:MAG: YopX family protein [Candidatus Babeliales bacterium]|nr:YopX family protein [Candidatus Babeliales bacterium]